MSSLEPSSAAMFLHKLCTTWGPSDLNICMHGMPSPSAASSPQVLSYCVSFGTDADEDDPPLAELITAGQRALLVPGGRGGRGNNSFKTGRNTAPAMAEKGEAGGEMFVDLELKVRQQWHGVSHHQH